MEFALALHTKTESTGSLTNNPVAVYLASLSAGSRRTMAQSLNTIALLSTKGLMDSYQFPWHQLTYSHTVAIRSALAERYAPATANKMLAAMKRVLEECKRLGSMSSQQYDSCTDLKPVKGSRPIRGRALSTQEVHAMFEACGSDTSNKGVRDAAMLSILRIGLRRSEVVGLNATDISSDGQVNVRHGKGDKARTVYLPKSYLPYMSYWLELRGRAGHDTDALFLGVSKSDRILGNRLTDQAVLVILQSRAEQAGITEKFSPHDWRRTCITDLLNAGVDIATVSKIAGHSQISTSKKYDFRDESVKREALEMLEL